MSNPGYSPRFIRFVLVPLHREAYEAAYLAYDQRSASSELARLHREFETLPPRHDCSCAPSFTGGGSHCLECARIQHAQQTMGTVVEIGRSSPVNPPMPDVLELDLARAMGVLHRGRTAETIARWLSDGSRL